MLTAPHGDVTWRDLLTRILRDGLPVAPRGQPTLEILHTNHLRVDMARAVVTSPARKLNYRFMVAEALWILRGDNQLAPLTRFVKRMANYSDDGVTLAGAYGPPVTAQLGYVVQALLADRDTRQAVLTIWRPCPAPSKDIPCTVAMSFSIRHGRLHQHVFMRSSDAWLGVPYDMFSFAAVGLRVACAYNARRGGDEPVLPGVLTISPTSSHLYERDVAAVGEVLASPPAPPPAVVPLELVRDGRWDDLEVALIARREDQLEPWMWQVGLNAEVG